MEKHAYGTLYFKFTIKHFIQIYIINKQSLIIKLVYAYN